MTFSISARCAETGRMGIAISSSSPAVAARCAWARAGAGVVASQNITDPTLGQRGLDLLAQGHSAADVLVVLQETGEHIDYRQLALVDRDGGTACYSGPNALGIFGAKQGAGAVVAGNLLAHDGVLDAMLDAYLAADAGQPLAARLIGAMQAGQKAGGEAGPVHSAGLLVVDRVSWPVTDLRVDWADHDPIGQLATLWDIWAPQEAAYVTRALDPRDAPSFGVPGDAD